MNVGDIADSIIDKMERGVYHSQTRKRRPMKLNMPAVVGGGNFTDRWQPKPGKNQIRVFPFEHEGELFLAAPETIHFVDNVPTPCLGTGCPICSESAAKEDRRLRKQTKYRMIVVDVDGDTEKFLSWPAPSTAYKHVKRICEGVESDPDVELEEILGNEGTDIIVQYDKNAQPQDMYGLSLRIRGSKPLSIDTDTLPDLFDELLKEGSDVVSGADHGDESGGPDSVTFIDDDGNPITGVDTGKTRKGKRVLEVDGRLVYVDEASIVNADEADTDSVISDNDIPKGHIRCAACEGAGKNSKGGTCTPCKGNGHIPDPRAKGGASAEEEETVTEYDWGEDVDSDYDMVVDVDGDPTYAQDTGNTKKVGGRIHHLVTIWDEDGEPSEVAIPRAGVLERRPE